MRVDVYWNLHKKCWSIKHKGKVIDHNSVVHIKNPKFVVQPAGRAKVLKEKRKNVHAFVRGELAKAEDISKHFELVRYNPYKYSTFVREDLTEIKTAKHAVLLSNGKCLARE